MKVRDSSIAFTATLLQPAARKPGESWCFLVLPKTVSDQMPRRGRTSVHGTVNGIAFQATLEPDGQLSHWLKLDKAALRLEGAVSIRSDTRRFDSVSKRAGDHPWSPSALPGQRPRLLGGMEWTGVIAE